MSSPSNNSQCVLTCYAPRHDCLFINRWMLKREKGAAEGVSNVSQNAFTSLPPDRGWEICWLALFTTATTTPVTSTTFVSSSSVHV